LNMKNKSASRKSNLSKRLMSYPPWKHLETYFMVRRRDYHRIFSYSLEFYRCVREMSIWLLM